MNLSGDNSAFSGGWAITERTKLNVLTANSLGTGSITIDSGTTFNADADLDIPAQLILNGVMTLDQNHSFDAVSIAGTVLPNGSYSFDELNARWDANFANGGSGSITVDNSIAPITYVLNKNQPGGNSWNTAADWTPNAVPAFGHNAEVSSNFTLRTPTSGSPTFFANFSMSAGSILLKTRGTAILARASFTGGSLSQGIGNNSTGSFGGDYTINGPLTINLNSTSGNIRTTNLTAQLSGAGLITADGGNNAANGNLNLTADNSAFSGGWRFKDRANVSANSATALGTGDISLESNSILDIDDDLNLPTTHLTITGGVLVLDQDHTLGELTIDGAIIPNGTYSFAELNTAFDSRFADGGSGSITVSNSIAPITYVLNKNQSFGNSWNTVADWTPNGVPTLGHTAEVNSNFLLRTPTSSNTFRAALKMNNGQIGLKTTGTATSINAQFDGGRISMIVSPNSTGTFAGNYLINSAITISLSSTTGDIRTTILAATLSGNGTLTVDGTNTATGGELHLNADNSALSGAWSIQDHANIVVNDANGLGNGDISLETTTSLDPNVDISNMGNLTLDGIITLDQNLTAATATVNGISLWKGSYDYADLTNLGLGAHFTNDGGTLTVLGPFATVVRFR